MLRAVWLTIGKEFLLIRRDRVGLFMLLIAPIAVIAAAGFSLAKIYGGRTAPRGEYSVAVFDEDHGAVARALLDAIAHQPDLFVIHSASRLDAQRTVREQKFLADRQPHRAQHHRLGKDTRFMARRAARGR